MKKIITLVLISTLSACYNITFDALEYDRYIFLKQAADTGYAQCGTDNVIPTIAKLKQDMDHQFLYSAGRISRPQVAVASKNLKSVIDRLYDQYQGNTPSVVYCQEKFKNISAGADNLIKELGKF